MDQTSDASHELTRDLVRRCRLEVSEIQLSPGEPLARPKRNIMFIYWGRRGALSNFTLDLARAALQNPWINATISISRQNESFGDFRRFGEAVLAVDTFRSAIGAVTGLPRLLRLRRRVMDRIHACGIETVIDLMPHVWSPFVAPAIKAAGARYIPIIHDARSHPGDRRSQITSFLRERTITQADLVFVLSGAVA